MPWPRHHKRVTRDRIVDAAAAAFRAGGVANVRVEDIMARAGLTHGGFYAHFASKDELLRDALDRAAAQTLEMLSGPLADAPDEDRMLALIDNYLSPAHAAHPEVGCPLATLAPELARVRGATHHRLAEAVKRRLEWMRRLQAPGRRNARAEDEAIGVLACLVGGMILARTVDAADSDAVLAASRRFLRAALQRSRRGARRAPRR